jgi:hypothetical protein
MFQSDCENSILTINFLKYRHTKPTLIFITGIANTYQFQENLQPPKNTPGN